MYRTIRNIVIIWSFLLGAVFGYSVPQGKVWLQGQVNSGGLIDEQGASSNALALSFNAAKESIEAFLALEDVASLNTQKVLSPFTDNKDDTTTFYIADKIISYNLLGTNTENEIQRLKALQNSDGGFGHSIEYVSSVIDTVSAFEALFLDTTSSEELSKAITFVLQNQESNGAWSDTEGDTLFTTATTLRALWLHRKSYDVQSAIEKSKMYLLTQQNSDGSYGDEIFESALVLRSIAPLSYDVTILQSTIDYLKATQQSSGSWAEDIYTTALVLQALHMADRDVPNPDLAMLSGMVVDGDTGVKLSGIHIELEDEANVTTASTGTFSFSGLKNGTYMLHVLSDNYAPLHTSIRLVGDDVDLGVLRLNKDANSTIAVLKGVIKDRKSGLVLTNVKIKIDNQQVVSDVNGSYLFDSIEAGTHTMSISKAGYIRKEHSITIPSNTIMLYSVLLDSIDFTVEAIIKGRVVDANGSVPLSGVVIKLSGAKEKELTTDSNGTFSFNQLGMGDYQVAMRKVGYGAVGSSFTIEQTSIIEYGDILLEAIDPAHVDTSVVVRGVVTQAPENSPLAGVTITVGGKEANTDSNGSYEIRDLVAGNLHIEATKEGYGTRIADANATEGARLIFSPSLSKTDENLSIFGTVLDSNNSEPLVGVQVAYSSADTNLTVTTDENGYYIITPIESGDATLKYSKVGYEDVGFEVSVGDKRVNVSPSLQSIFQENEDNNASISAVVFDRVTGLVLPNTAVRIVGNFDNINMVTDENGTLLIKNIKSYDTNLTLTKNMYKTKIIPMHLAKNIKYQGLEFQLLPNNASNFETDISIENLENKIYCNPFTFDTNGTLILEIKNNSLYPITNTFKISTFYDENNNRLYDENEIFISHKIIDEIFKRNETKIITIDINISLPFRDAPITIYVDSENSIFESDEENNIVTTSDVMVSKECK